MDRGGCAHRDPYGDRYSPSWVLSLTCALRGLAFVLLSWLPRGDWIYVYAIVLGISWTATTPPTAAIAADVYGRGKIGIIFGSMFAFMNIGFGVGAHLDELAYDLTGRYSTVIVINAVFGFAAATVVISADLGRLRPARFVRESVSSFAPDTSAWI